MERLRLLYTAGRTRRALYCEPEAVLIALLITLAGCTRAPSLGSSAQATAGRTPLSAAELDILTASGESQEPQVLDPSASYAGSQYGLTRIENSADSPSMRSAPSAAARSLTIPRAGQYNGIRQAR